MLEIRKDLEFLRQKSKKVKNITDETGYFIDQMKETLEKSEGVGLAAPQVGRLQRIIVVRNENGFFGFINPVILKRSREKEEIEEGCLSLPGCFLKIRRPERITAKALNSEGKEIALNLKGLAARAFQHEVDHLDGILIFDRLPLAEKIKRFFKEQPGKIR